MSYCRRCGIKLTEYNSDVWSSICSDCKRQEDADNKQAELAEEQRRHAEELAEKQRWEAEKLAEEQRRFAEEQTEERRRIAERQMDEQRWIAQEQHTILRETEAWDHALPKCKWCGKPYSFAPADNSFFEYCSRKCASEALGRERLDEYSRDVIPLVKEQINKSFQPNGNIHKAIVYSEGFSQYFTVAQHIIIAGAIKQHRSHFLSNSELERLVAYHYEQAFLKGTLEQKIIFACTPWKNQLRLEGTSLPDCNLPVNLALQYISRIFEENGSLPSRYVAIFKQVFNFVNDNDLKVSKKNCRNSLLCAIVDKEIRNREERRRQEEEERRRQEEERRRQKEEKRKRQEDEERKRQEEERKRQEEEQKHNKVQELTNKIETTKKDRWGCLIAFFVFYPFLILLTSFMIGFTFENFMSVLRYDPVKAILRLLFTLPLVFVTLGLLWCIYKAQRDWKKEISELQQKLNESKKQIR